MSTRGRGRTRSKATGRGRQAQVVRSTDKLMRKHALGHGEQIDLKAAMEWDIAERWKEYVDVEPKARRIKDDVPSWVMLSDEGRKFINLKQGEIFEAMKMRRADAESMLNITPEEAAKRREVALSRSPDLHSTHERMEEHDSCVSAVSVRYHRDHLAEVAASLRGSAAASRDELRTALWGTRFAIIHNVPSATTANSLTLARSSSSSSPSSSAPAPGAAASAEAHENTAIGCNITAALRKCSWFPRFDSMLAVMYRKMFGGLVKLSDVVEALAVSTGSSYVRWTTAERNGRPDHRRTKRVTITLHFSIPHSTRFYLCVVATPTRPPTRHAVTETHSRFDTGPGREPNGAGGHPSEHPYRRDVNRRHGDGDDDPVQQAPDQHCVDPLEDKRNLYIRMLCNTRTGERADTADATSTRETLSLDKDVPVMLERLLYYPCMCT